MLDVFLLLLVLPLAYCSAGRSPEIDESLSSPNDFSSSSEQYSTLQMWNALDMIIQQHNYGCFHKNPHTNKGKSLCKAEADRLNPYAYGHMRPIQMRVSAIYINQLLKNSGGIYCEIGMNGGHSTVAALMLNSKIRVHSFDMHEWTYSPKVVQFLDTTFSNRFLPHAGSSFSTVPEYFKVASHEKCDIAFIDGLHTYNGVKKDLGNMRLAVKKKHLVLLDDIHLPEVRAAITECVKEGNLKIEAEFLFSIDSEEACFPLLVQNRKVKLTNTRNMSLGDVSKAFKLVRECPTALKGMTHGFGFMIARFIM